MGGGYRKRIFCRFGVWGKFFIVDVEGELCSRVRVIFVMEIFEEKLGGIEVRKLCDVVKLSLLCSLIGNLKWLKIKGKSDVM